MARQKTPNSKRIHVTVDSTLLELAEIVMTPAGLSKVPSTAMSTVVNAALTSYFENLYGCSVVDLGVAIELGKTSHAELMSVAGSLKEGE